jgi:opacity protein-like surface antigen
MRFFNRQGWGRALLLTAVLAVGSVSTVSAVDMSWGLGPFLAIDIGAGYFGLKGERNYDVNGININAKIEEESPWHGFGLNFFFDATYAELNLGFLYGSGERTGTQINTGSDYTGIHTVTLPIKDSIEFLDFCIGVLGKYPIALTENLTIFPLAGIEYAIVLEGSTMNDISGKAYDAGDFSTLSFKFGTGLDLSMSKKWYFRPEILYGFRLANAVETGQIDIAKKSGGKMETISSHGLTVKIGFGRKI